MRERLVAAKRFGAFRFATSRIWENSVTCRFDGPPNTAPGDEYERTRLRLPGIDSIQ
jgi:hypothetical protein